MTTIEHHNTIENEPKRMRNETGKPDLFTLKLQKRHKKQPYVRT